MTHIKFPSIGSFANVYRGQQYFGNPDLPDVSPAVVKYGAKIKLHGTNAAVRIEDDGTVTAQGRNRDLREDADQFGFATWVVSNAYDWEKAARNMHEGFAGTDQLAEPVVFHGEWAGPGVQKKDAVTLLDQKYFFIFAVEIDGTYVTDPAYIESYAPDLDQMLVLPWQVECPDTVDFSEKHKCGFFAEWADELAQSIGEVDPFIKEVFEIEGPGEGLVFMPMWSSVDRDMFSRVTFKAKTEDHNVKKGPSVSRDIVVPDSVEDFVDMFVTDARCEQAVAEACEGVAEPERTGAFMKWIGQDVKKESEVELLDMEIEWKAVQSFVMKAARTWFLNKCKMV